MARSETPDAIEYGQQYVDRITLSRAALAGFLGGIVYGFVIHFFIGRMPAIGALYVGGSGSLAVGWVAPTTHRPGETDAIA